MLTHINMSLICQHVGLPAGISQEQISFHSIKILINVFVRPQILDPDLNQMDCGQETLVFIATMMPYMARSIAIDRNSHQVGFHGCFRQLTMTYYEWSGMTCKFFRMGLLQQHNRSRRSMCISFLSQWSHIHWVHLQQCRPKSLVPTSQPGHSNYPMGSLCRLSHQTSLTKKTYSWYE